MLLYHPSLELRDTIFVTVSFWQLFTDSIQLINTGYVYVYIYTIYLHIYNIYIYIILYYIILYYIVLYYIIFTYINIRRQCKWCELENKLNNNDKVIIKTRCTCYFLIIFRGLPLLFQNNVWISYMENFNLKRHILHINQWQSKLIPASKRAFESLQSFTKVLQNCRTSAISICY